MTSQQNIFEDSKFQVKLKEKIKERLTNEEVGDGQIKFPLGNDGLKDEENRDSI